MKRKVKGRYIPKVTQVRGLGDTELIPPVEILKAEFASLPFSLRLMVENETRRRQKLKLPLQIEERQAAMIKRFKGDRPR